VPVIGPQTVETCAAAGVAGITIEAGKTLLLEKERVAALCVKFGIGIHAF
jgi:UDP-2,3-diacylglucosamine hydrolase